MGERGRVWRWGMRESTYLSLHCHHQNDSCIKVGSNESHFNVSRVVRDSHKTMSTNRNLFEEKGNMKHNQAEALLLTSIFYQQVFISVKQLLPLQLPVQFTCDRRTSRQKEVFGVSPQLNILSWGKVQSFTLTVPLLSARSSAVLIWHP